MYNWKCTSVLYILNISSKTNVQQTPSFFSLKAQTLHLTQKSVDQFSCPLSINDVNFERFHYFVIKRHIKNRPDGGKVPTIQNINYSRRNLPDFVEKYVKTPFAIFECSFIIKVSLNLTGTVDTKLLKVEPRL